VLSILKPLVEVTLYHIDQVLPELLVPRHTSFE
jgi:hypothetical protein